MEEPPTIVSTYESPADRGFTVKVPTVKDRKIVGEIVAMAAPGFTSYSPRIDPVTAGRSRITVKLPLGIPPKAIETKESITKLLAPHLTRVCTANMILARPPTSLPGGQTIVHLAIKASHTELQQLKGKRIATFIGNFIIEVPIYRDDKSLQEQLKALNTADNS